VWRPDFHRRTNPPNPPRRSVPPKPPHRPKPSKAPKQLGFLDFFLFLLNGFLRFWLVVCYLDFGFVVVGGGGGGLVVNDGDGCDER
jgi:hypothetical protein